MNHRMKIAMQLFAAWAAAAPPALWGRTEEAVNAAPVDNPGSWITPQDYPPMALARHESGATEFRLEVDAQGVPGACTIISSSGSDMLDQATCALVRERARFTPAQDRRGKAVAGTYSNRVRWAIPEHGPREIQVTPVPQTMSFAVDVDVDGNIKKCAVLVNSITVDPFKGAAPPDPCAPSVVSGLGAIVRDKDGNPVRATIVRTLTVEVKAR